MRAEQRARDNQRKWERSEEEYQHWRQKAEKLQTEAANLEQELEMLEASSRAASATSKDLTERLESFECPSPPWWQELGKIALSAGGGYALCKLTG